LPAVRRIFGTFYPIEVAQREATEAQITCLYYF